jgi:lipopolysaccharide export system protein LptA
MTTDTLLYNVNTEVANFVSPTVINDGKTKILTKSGFYDLKKGNASFTKRPVIIDSVQTVIADSIFYNKKTGEGLANGDVTYKDSAQGIFMRAGAAQFNNQSKSINAYKRPLMALKQNTDSIYIAADTLFSAYLKRDSTKKIMVDTIRFFSAFYDVKIFSDSLQGKSDSLFYSGFDSTFSFYKEPVIWAEGSQISGDTIYLVTRNKKPDQVFVNENAYSINRTNEGLYNQLKGTNMNGQFINGEIDFLRAKGNSESLYYLQDDDSSYIGMNYAMADAITMKFINKELKRVTWVNGVSGTTYPMNKIPDDKKQLRNFKWLDALRPKTLEDLYKK